MYNYSDFVKWQRYKAETKGPARLLNHKDNKYVLAGQQSTAFSWLFLEPGIIAVISKSKMTRCIAHLYLRGDSRQVGPACTTTTILEPPPYISQAYYYPILHHQPAPKVEAPPKMMLLLEIFGSPPVFPQDAKAPNR